MTSGLGAGGEFGIPLSLPTVPQPTPAYVFTERYQKWMRKLVTEYTRGMWVERPSWCKKHDVLREWMGEVGQTKPGWCCPKCFDEAAAYQRSLRKDWIEQFGRMY